MNKKEISNLIQDLIKKTSIVVNDILITEEENKDNFKTIWFEIKVNEPYFFLNKNGEGLFALNHIIRRIISKPDKNIEPEDDLSNKTRKDNINILIDINGFQKKRIENVRAMVHMMAERARYFKSNIEIEPMSAYERRIVHEFLSDAIDLKTESEGVGRNRRVIIKYIGDIK